jgi:hypothetical protein
MTYSGEVYDYDYDDDDNDTNGIYLMRFSRNKYL